MGCVSLGLKTGTPHGDLPVGLTTDIDYWGVETCDIGFCFDRMAYVKPVHVMRC